MAKRKGWADLSNTYRNRLQGKGITENQYSAGTSLEAARGHVATPEHARVTLTVQGRTTVTRSYAAMAVRGGVVDILPTFDTLSRAEQNRVGKLYIKSFFEKGTGGLLNKAEKQKRGLHPKDRRVYRHAGEEQINGRIEFQQFVDENRKKKWNKSAAGWNNTDWEDFRTGYATFSSE